MGVHMNAAVPDAPAGDLDIQTMKNYVAYCKSYAFDDSERAQLATRC